MASAVGHAAQLVRVDDFGENRGCGRAAWAGKVLPLSCHGLGFL